MAQDWPPTKAEVINAAVDRGIELLNEKRPGWVEKIDISHLDLSNACMCVVGQIYGDANTGVLGSFTYGVRDLLGDGYGFNDCSYHGFEYGDGYNFDAESWDESDDSPYDYSYFELEYVWKLRLRELKGI